MATAGILQWVPDSLYNLSVSVTVGSYHTYRAEIKCLPDNVQFDVLYKVRLMWCLHDPANVQQISSKCIQNTRAGRLLDRVNTLLASCVGIWQKVDVALVLGLSLALEIG